MKSLKRFGLAAVLALITALCVTQPTQVEAAATSSYSQNKLIDQVFRAQTALTPATIYVGLYTGTINAQSCGGEVSGGSYARQAVTSSLANWAGTQGAGTTSASSNSSGSSGTTSNNNAITFPSPTANWTTITGFCLHDSVSGGNELIYAPLTTPKTVNSGDAAPSFAAGALTITIGAVRMPESWRFHEAANDSAFAAAA